MSNKGLASRILKEYLQIHRKDSPVEKWVKDLTRHFTNDQMTQQTCDEVFNFFRSINTCRGREGNGVCIGRSWVEMWP